MEIDWAASAQPGCNHGFICSMRCWLVKSLPIKEVLVNVTSCIACSHFGNCYSVQVQLPLREQTNMTVRHASQIFETQECDSKIQMRSVLVYPTNIFSCKSLYILWSYLRVDLCFI